jgi:hypothetical protein
VALVGELVEALLRQLLGAANEHQVGAEATI